MTLGQAIGEASGHSGYRYLSLGFFVCGFQVAFIAVHLPAYLGDVGLTGETAALALALIGFFNIIGTFTCGMLGDIYSKKYLLSLLYLLRSLVIAAFLLAPKTETTVLVFAAAMGFLWLGTVPLTSGLVGQIFGVRYLSTPQSSDGQLPRRLAGRLHLRRPGHLRPGVDGLHPAWH